MIIQGIYNTTMDLDKMVHYDTELDFVEKMYAANFRPETGAQIQVNGRGEIGFSCQDGYTKLSHLYQHDPVRVLFPDVPSDEVKQGIVVTTSGGLVGGDSISLDLTFDERTSAMVMAQAAEKIYGSHKDNCSIEVDLKAETLAWAEYLPQETILFDGARLNRTTRIEAEVGAKILAGEYLVFGRRGSGESFSSGYLRDAWEVRRENKLIWADTLLLENNVSEILNHPACLDDAAAAATVVFIGDDAETYLREARAILEDNCGTIRAGVSAVNGILVARLIGKDTLNLRYALGGFWQHLRHTVGLLPMSMPRLWQI